MSSYTVHYLAGRARAEPIWLLLAYAGIPAKRHDLTLAELGSGARAEQFGSKQLPCLEIDGRIMSQSGAIMRYLARQHGLDSSDPWESALLDEVFELSQELAKVNPLVNLWDPTQERIDEFFKSGAGTGSGYPVMPRVAALSESLGQKSFFGGEKPKYPDFNVFHYLDNLDTLVPGILDGHHNLVEWMCRVASLPGIKEYLKNRPQIGSTELGKPGTRIQSTNFPPKKWGSG